MVQISFQVSAKTENKFMNGAYEKILPLEELGRACAAYKKAGKRVVQCHGVFDLLHPGHIYHFKAAKKQGDVLVVTITPDEYVNKGPGRPVFNHKLRAESIAAVECVDHVAVNKWPAATETIKLLRPAVYAKGKEYFKKESDITGKIYEEEEAVRSVGGRVYFTDEPSFSSSALINMHFDVFSDETKAFLNRFKERHSADAVINYLKKIAGLRVMVIGDAIIDEYHYCQGMGKSQKNNIIAAKYLYKETFNGGALAVASHIANFCGSVKLVTMLGEENSYEDFIRKTLNKNIDLRAFMRPNAPTVTKQRFLDPAFLGKMLEVCHIDDNVIGQSLESEVLEYLDKNIANYDVVVVADFGHGFITESVIDRLCRKARFLAVNAQTNSANIGFNLAIKYPKAGYMCIDEPELRLAVHDKFSELKTAMGKLMKIVDCGNLIVTRGHEGSCGFSPKSGFVDVPVFSKEVVDRIGAGDAFLAITAPLAAMGYPMEVINFVGNAVGAMAVLIVGNRSFIEPVPLYKYITTLLK